MRDAAKDEALRLLDIEAVRSHVKPTDVVGFVVIDRVGDIRIREIMHRDFAVSDFIHFNQVFHSL